MTIKELYEWAKEKGLENFDLKVYDTEYGEKQVEKYDIEVAEKTKEVTIIG